MTHFGAVVIPAHVPETSLDAICRVLVVLALSRLCLAPIVVVETTTAPASWVALPAHPVGVSRWFGLL